MIHNIPIKCGLLTWFVSFSVTLFFSFMFLSLTLSICVWEWVLFYCLPPFGMFVQTSDIRIIHALRISTTWLHSNDFHKLKFHCFYIVCVYAWSGRPFLWLFFDEALLYCSGLLRDDDNKFEWVKEYQVIINKKYVT